MRMQSHELRKNMKKALDEVEHRGRRIVIVRNGVPVADLVPHGAAASVSGAPTMGTLIADFRASGPLVDVTDAELDALRDRSRERRRR